LLNGRGCSVSFLGQCLKDGINDSEIFKCHFEVGPTKMLYVLKGRKVEGKAAYNGPDF
jgi:hypothetical protein